MSPTVPRVIPGVVLSEDAAAAAPIADTRQQHAFDALVRRRSRAISLRESNPAPLLRGLTGGATQDTATPHFPPTQRDTSAFAHRSPAPQDRSVAQSATSSSAAFHQPNQPNQPNQRDHRDQAQIANRRLRQTLEHLDGGGSSHRDARAQAPTPIVRRELTGDEVRFAKVAEYVLNRARDFCTNDAVLKSGTWQTQFAIDPKIMPDCVLRLSLSGSELTLRFDSADVTSRALISKYAGILKARLAALMTERGTSRDIEIVSS